MATPPPPVVPPSDKMEKTMEVMKLTTPQECAMLERVQKWWEGRSYRMSMVPQVDSVLVAAVLSRALLGFSDMDTQMLHDEESTFAASISTPNDDDPSSKPSTVSPDEDTTTSRNDDTNKTSWTSSEQHSPSLVATKKGGNSNGMRNLRPEYCFGLASDLATLLDDNNHSNNPSITTKPAPPTVSYVVSTLATLLKPVMATDLYRSLFHNNNASEQVLATKLLKNLLEAMARSTKSAVEAHYDFEYMWTGCSEVVLEVMQEPKERSEKATGETKKKEEEDIDERKDEKEEDANDEMMENEEHADDEMVEKDDDPDVKTTESEEDFGDDEDENEENVNGANEKEDDTDANKKENDEDAHGDKDEKMEKDEKDEDPKHHEDSSPPPRSMKEYARKLSYLAALINLHQEVTKANEFKHGAFVRRRRIITTAAVLTLLASFGEVWSTGEENEGESEPVSSDEKENEDSEEGPSSRPPRTMEEDAIAALSMMVNGSFESAASTSTTAEAGKPKDHPVQVILSCTNALLSSLRVYAQKGSVELMPRISRAKLEDAAWDLAKQIVAITPEQYVPNIATIDSSWSFAGKLKALFPTQAEFERLVNGDLFDEIIATRLKTFVRCVAAKKEIMYPEGFPFVDETQLHPPHSHLVSRLCPVSLNGNVAGAALICLPEGKTSGEMIPLEYSASPLAGTTNDQEMREIMELNEWTASILDHADVRPSTRLMLYLEASDDESCKQKKKRPDGVMEEVTTGGGWRSVIIPVLNRAIKRMINEDPKEEDGTTHEKVEVLPSTGEVVVHGDEDDAEITLCKALVALFYHSLESILFHETARLKSASHPRLLMSEPFLRALLTCCCICLMKGLCSTGALVLGEKYTALDFPCIQRIMENGPYTYLKVSESFARALKLDKSRGKLRSPLVLGLPRLLQRELSKSEILVVDSLLWAHETTFALDICVMDVIADYKYVPNEKAVSAWPPEVLQPTLPEEIDDWKDQQGPNGKMKFLKRTGPVPPDHVYLSYVLRKLLKIAFFRISAFCNELEIPPEYPIASQVWIAFRYLLRHNIELLYDRHVDQLILCTLYGVCKIMRFQPELTFSKIIEIYTKVRGGELGERTCHRLVRHIKLISNEESMDGVDEPDLVTPPKKKKRTYGNVIHLYNEVFVPAMKAHLLKSKSLKKAIENLKLCQSGKRKRSPSSGAADEAMAAARAAANQSGNWVTEGATTTVRDGNVKFCIRLPMSGENAYNPAFRVPPQKKQKGKKGASDSRWDNPDNRVFYCFGEASAQSLQLMNAVVR